MYQNGERTRGRTPLGVDVIRRRTPNHVRTVPTHRRSGCNGDLTSNSDAERVGKSQAGVSILAAQIRLFFIHRYPPNGEGVLQDDVEAVAWYRRAAEQGESGARRCVHRGRAGCPWLHVQHRPGRTAGRRRSGGVRTPKEELGACASSVRIHTEFRDESRYLRLRRAAHHQHRHHQDYAPTQTQHTHTVAGSVENLSKMLRVVLGVARRPKSERSGAVDTFDWHHRTRVRSPSPDIYRTCVRQRVG